LSESGLFVVAAPSGGGKTSLINSLLDKDRQIKLSVSHTTRPARPGEVDGVHYHFVDEETFLDLMERDAFLEHAQVFDYRYGTGREAVEQQLAAGFDVILDIDWQGARQIRSTFPTCRTIFIIPPSVESLRQRLVRRGQDSEAVIRRRMRDAQAEISHWDEFDAIIVNDDFERALSELHALVRSEKQPSQTNSSQSMEVLAELLGTR
jgi:guanylate kinase